MTERIKYRFLFLYVVSVNINKLFLDASSINKGKTFYQCVKHKMGNLIFSLSFLTSQTAGIEFSEKKVTLNELEEPFSKIRITQTAVGRYILRYPYKHTSALRFTKLNFLLPQCTFQKRRRKLFNCKWIRFFLNKFKNM